MAEHKTSKDHPVDHSHAETDLHAADQEIARDFLAKLFPQAEVVKPATLNYNCHGFAFAPTHLGWYNFPDLFISDDYTGTAMDSPEPGDVLIYSLEGILTHSAVVIEVSGGKIVRVQSKWGGIAEVKHPTSHVPDVYGAPIVLLRTQPGVPKHTAAGAGVSAATAGAGGAEEPAGATTDAAGGGVEAAAGMEMPAAATGTTGQGPEAPERFMLMLASTPEVRRRILQSSTIPLASGTEPFDATKSADTIDVAAATLSVTAAGSAPSEIEKALAELSAPVSQFHLMLASTPEVLRSAASRLPPVQGLIRIGAKDPRVKKAVIEFFKRPETQNDEQVAGIVLYLMSQLPSKEAVAPIARYLQVGEFSSFNGGLAVEALRAAISMTNA